MYIYTYKKKKHRIYSSNWIIFVSCDLCRVTLLSLTRYQYIEGVLNHIFAFTFHFGERVFIRIPHSKFRIDIVILPCHIAHVVQLDYGGWVQSIANEEQK